MKRLFLFLTVAAAVCCAACSDDPEVAESNLSLLEDNVTFDMFGGRSVLEITADSPWTVSCDDDWCRTNVAEGSHTKKIVLTVDQSFLPEERTTAVRFYAAGEEKHSICFMRFASQMFKTFFQAPCVRKRPPGHEKSFNRLLSY